MSLFRKLVGIFQAAGVALRKRLLGGVPAVFVEDVFSTFLYTGTSATQTITNNIDLSTNGGLVWLKNRNSTQSHWLFDSARGAESPLSSNRTNTVADNVATYFGGSNLCVFNSNGFTFNGAQAQLGTNGNTYTSWTFRKKSKFFDIVTYTGNGVAGREIPHNLGSVPGCVIIKAINGETNWPTWHRGMATDQVVFLNTGDGKYAEGDFYATAPTSSVFTVYSNGRVNGSGSTYVAYLFAHNAGGFGPTGSDNVISCGTYTGDGAAGGQLINLGYEAQWVMIKNVAGGGWWMVDIMRGYQNSISDFGGDNSIDANGSAGDANQVIGHPSAQGFTAVQDNVNQSGQTYIYMAIRKGPMKVPTDATTVFAVDRPSSSGTFTMESPFAPDFAIAKGPGGGDTTYVGQRLTGAIGLNFQTTAEEYALGYTWNMTGAAIGGTGNYSTWISYLFKRAPGFFDVVCYKGTGASSQTKTHNLGVTPELMIIKCRGPSGYTQPWVVYPGPLGTDQYNYLNTTAAAGTFGSYWPTPPTSTGFTVGNYQDTNASTLFYVAYLFATCAGVSKVGSYTGTATTKQVDCGFTAGARFVLIKRTDSTGDWYVWDTTRGIVSGDDPYGLLNSSAAEVTNTDYIDPYNAGFELSSTAPAAINANGGTYIFLAIA